MKKICLLAIMTLVMAVTSTAHAGGWRKLGEKTVNLMAEHDVIEVNDHHKYSNLKLRVRDQGVEFRRVTVVYGDGSRRELPVRKFIPRDGETMSLQLPRGERYIKRIILNYKTRGGSIKKARVSVWGKRA